MPVTAADALAFELNTTDPTSCVDGGGTSTYFLQEPPQKGVLQLKIILYLIS